MKHTQTRHEASADTVQRFRGHLTKHPQTRQEEFVDPNYREVPYTMVSNRSEIFARGAMFVYRSSVCLSLRIGLASDGGIVRSPSL